MPNASRPSCKVDGVERKALARTTVLIERRGKAGKSSKNKPKGLKPSRQYDQLLEVIVRHFDDVYQQLNEHMRLIATIQQQVNGLIESARRLSNPRQE